MNSVLLSTWSISHLAIILLISTRQQGVEYPCP